MVVVAFVQGITTSPFSDSLIKNSAEMLSEVRERATAHIKIKEVVLKKMVAHDHSNPGTRKAIEIVP